jgi:RNA polymerase sigma-70 factor (family 1)
MTPLRSHTDQEIITLLIQGDRQIFASLYKENVHALMTYVRRSISVKEDCEEIVQEVFESLWLRHESLHHVTSIRGYLFRMVKYKIVDYLRHSIVKRKYEEHYILFEGIYDDLNETIDDPLDFSGLLEKSISELPDRCQAAFRLRLHENLPYKDIADRMSISTKTVENHISAALRHLRNVYQNFYRAG